MPAMHLAFPLALPVPLVLDLLLLQAAQQAPAGGRIQNGDR